MDLFKDFRFLYRKTAPAIASETVFVVFDKSIIVTAERTFRIIEIVLFVAVWTGSLRKILVLLRLVVLAHKQSYNKDYKGTDHSNKGRCSGWVNCKKKHAQNSKHYA